ncbi:MAG: manganese efflux pump [Deltaproteobacteria bacterium]|nr:manganese efflux pump [Deltaproteobacteria bacterium]
MELYALLGIAIALAMDAFAVALSAGVILPVLTGRHLFRLSFHFGLFQGLMPIIGWLIGARIYDLIADYDHWVAFVLLMFIGIRMVHEAFACDDDAPRRDPTRGMTLVTLSVATSIDALVVGLTLGVLKVDVWYPALVIGVVAALFTMVGMILGRRVGALWGQRMEVFGGVLLCCLGVKILIEHLMN